MIQYCVEEAVGAGAEEIILVVSEGKEAIFKHFTRNERLESFLKEKGKDKEKEYEEVFRLGKLCQFQTVIQDEQLGLGHAVLCAEKLVGGEHFGVILADDIVISKRPALAQLAEISLEFGAASVVGVMEVPREETSKYGICAGEFVNDRTLRLFAMIEKPKPEDAPSNLATPGRYIFENEIFRALKGIKKGVGGEYQLTDAINAMAKERPLYAHLFSGDRFDTGTPEGHLFATLELAKREPRYLSVLKEALSQS